MPVKWTAETDQVLLLKILETSAVSVDVKKVSAAWPTNLETPTPRAISERLVRIRALAKSSNGSSAHFAVSNGKASTPKSTPSKAMNAKATPKSKVSLKKRKRGGRMSEENTSTPDPSEMQDLGSSSGAEAEDLPAQKQKKPRASKTKAEPLPSPNPDEEVFNDKDASGGIFDAGAHEGTEARVEEEEWV